MSNPESFVGIDVAKGWLDVAWLTGETLRIDHAEKAIAGLVERLRSQPPALVVMEATGGLETGVASALAAAGLAVAVVNPRQVRDYAKACGRLAKTDRFRRLYSWRAGEMHPEGMHDPAVAHREQPERREQQREIDRQPPYQTGEFQSRVLRGRAHAVISPLAEFAQGPSLETGESKTHHAQRPRYWLWFAQDSCVIG